MKNLIPNNARDEFVRNLRAAGTSENKKAQARKLLGSRLIMKNGMPWWNVNGAEVRAEMDKIEQEIIVNE